MLNWNDVLKKDKNIIGLIQVNLSSTNQTRYYSAIKIGTEMILNMKNTCQREFEGDITDKSFILSICRPTATATRINMRSSPSGKVTFDVE